MKITHDTTIVGLPAFRVRAMLRQSGKTIAWPLCCYPAYATPADTLAVVDRLVAAGLLQLQNDLGHLKLFRRTAQGTALANAAMPAPLRRAEAIALVEQVMEFLDTRSQDTTEELEVTELRVFGELACGAEQVPHVEIGVILRYRMAAFDAEVGDPYQVDAEAAARFLARLMGLHPSLCVRRVLPQGAA